MTTAQAYYEGLAQDQVKNCMSNRKLKNMMDEKIRIGKARCDNGIIKIN